MNRTAVDQKLFKAAVDSLPADQLAAIRGVAASRFTGMNFPGVGDEDWKYTNLSAAANLSNSWLQELAANQDSEIEPAGNYREYIGVVAQIDANWILIRDGMVDEKSLQALQQSIGTDVTVARIGDADHEFSADSDALSVFNAALLRDGLVINVSANAKPGKPLGILYADSSASRVSQARILISAADNSHLQVVECALSLNDGEQFTNSVFQANLQIGAQLDHVRIQDRSRDHIGVNRVHVTLGRDASYDHNGYDIGGSLTRNDVVAEINGPDASVRLHGLYLASGDQHIDNHTSVLHKVGPATSVEEYRGILNGRSRCVFNGKAVVSPGADGTDASQSNHNLLLSDKAEIDTKPELEIYADEVKCSHGATVGQLDESALFYLRSRGLDTDEARRLLTRAFAAGTLGELAIDECHGFLEEALDRRLRNLIDESK